MTVAGYCLTPRRTCVGRSTPVPPFTRKTAFAIARGLAVLRENSVFNVLNLNLVQRLEEAPKDLKFGLEYIKREARTPGQQQGGIEALMFGADLLWA